MNALVKTKEYAFTTYKPLEVRIRKGDLDSLLARWEFGKKLLEERGDKKKLPNGRLDQLAKLLANQRSELKNRVQFAEQYPSEAKVRAVFKEYGSWYSICQGGLGARGVPEKEESQETEKEELPETETEELPETETEELPETEKEESTETETAQQALAWLRKVSSSFNEWESAFQEGGVAFSPEGWQFAARIFEKLSVRFAKVAQNLVALHTKEKEKENANKTK